jgi:hypothetical protein
MGQGEGQRVMVVIGGKLRDVRHCSRVDPLLSLSLEVITSLILQELSNLSKLYSCTLDLQWSGLPVGECSPRFEMHGCFALTSQQICWLGQSFLS